MSTNKIFLFLIPAVVLFENSYSQSQFYYNTWEVLHRTDRLRKSQKVNSVNDATYQDGIVTINFTATLNKKIRQQPYHISLNIDSILAYYKNKPNFFYKFDSTTAKKLGAVALDRIYSNISKIRPIARGIEISCSREILTSGYSSFIASKQNISEVEILSGIEHPYEFDNREILKGKHIVFLFYLNAPKIIDGEEINYLVLNIENSPDVRKINYLKLPYTLILDTIEFPFNLMLSGMKK